MHLPGINSFIIRKALLSLWLGKGRQALSLQIFKFAYKNLTVFIDLTFFEWMMHLWRRLEFAQSHPLFLGSEWVHFCTLVFLVLISRSSFDFHSQSITSLSSQVLNINIWIRKMIHQIHMNPKTWMFNPNTYWIHLICGIVNNRIRLISHLNRFYSYYFMLWIIKPVLLSN